MVDDDPTIRRIAEICLTRIGNWQVTSVDSGYEALQILQTFVPDTIVLDVMMRGMDGPVLLKRIRANEALADVPVIFLTALVQPQEIDSYLEMGVAGVIIKPFDPLKLSAEVTRISEQ
ncbi:MAG: response regulator [Candidatus Obscuribacterales bacterium]|nr:response regulator [Candidatus Obscuribacterales bacterium]